MSKVVWLSASLEWRLLLQEEPFSAKPSISLYDNEKFKLTDQKRYELRIHNCVIKLLRRVLICSLDSRFRIAREMDLAEQWL